MQVNRCQFDGSSKGSKCIFCGAVLPVDYAEPPSRPCGIKQPALIGDMTERALKKIGVTPERYAEVRELFGGAPAASGCRCAKRREKLNDWHRKVRAWWQGQG